MYLSRELQGESALQNNANVTFWGLNNLQWSGQMLTFGGSDPTSETDSKLCS